MRMRDTVCRVEAGATAVDYSSVSRTSLSSGSWAFSGMLQEQMQPLSAFDSVVDPILLYRSRASYGPGPVRFGIHQDTLKDYDPQGKIATHVTQLTAAKARLIYQRIWERSGAETLPAEMQAIHFETYIKRPQIAMSALEKAGGSLEAYMNARQNMLAVGKKRSLPEYSAERFLAIIRNAPSITDRTVAVPERHARSAKTVSGDFETAVGFILKHEGRALVRNDGGKGPSKYGILQTTLQEYDPQGLIAKNVTELDDAKAKQIYQKIWQRSGSDKLPYPLNIIHFDTYLHRPRTAQESMAASGGDPIKYLEIRQTSLRGLRSYKKYGMGWERRIGGLAQLADASAGSEIRKKA